MVDELDIVLDSVQAIYCSLQCLQWKIYPNLYVYFPAQHQCTETSLTMDSSNWFECNRETLMFILCFILCRSFVSLVLSKTKIWKICKRSPKIEIVPWHSVKKMAEWRWLESMQECHANQCETYLQKQLRQQACHYECHLVMNSSDCVQVAIHHLCEPHCIFGLLDC